MRIGIDISQIVFSGTGVARFTEGLVSAILKYEKDNQWYFFFTSLRKKLEPDLEGRILNSNHRLIKLPLPLTLVEFFFNDLHSFSKVLTKNLKFLSNLDWFITSDWIEPWLPIKKATIIHDLVFKRYPETVHPKIIKTQEKRLIHVKNESKIIFTDTYSTKKDLINFFKINSQKIFVNYPGVEVFQPTKTTIQNVLKKFQLFEKKFILTVSKIEPRKNLKRLIYAFNQLKNNEVDLVIVGEYGWGEKIKNENKKIKFLGYISDTQLYSLYSSCLFFVFPSIWEGFGYPLVEAMNFQIPIVCSNALPIKEIVKDTALFFNPFNINDITDKMKKMIKDNKLRNQLIEKSKIRRKNFSWEKYFKKLIKILKNF